MHAYYFFLFQAMAYFTDYCLFSHMSKTAIKANCYYHLQSFHVLLNASRVSSRLFRMMDALDLMNFL